MPECGAIPEDGTMPEGGAMTASSMTNRESVGRQYASPDRLQTRVAIWGPGPAGVSPRELVRDAIVSLRPRKLLEIGCGTGDLAAEVLGLLPGCAYLATDRSPGMVASALANGVHAAQVDATALPYADSTYDVVVAAWMLYHVPDLHTTLREVARVLRPGGTFLAVTNGNRHLETLLRDAGGEPLVTQFSSENGEQVLRGHFRVVGRRDVETRAHFQDHAAAVAMLASFDDSLAAGLPRFEGPRDDAGYTTLFAARPAL